MKVLIAIPAYNEEQVLANNIIKILQYCQQNLADDFIIVIADNNSTDQTSKIARELSQEHFNVNYLFVEIKGKGIAIRTAWREYENDCDIFVFMDADLATDLKSLPDLIQSIKSGNDVAIGSRYLKDSEVTKTILRRIFSYAYRLVLKVFLGTKIKDLPCGFKAVNKRVIEEILPQVDNNTWFFDNEMVYISEKRGLKIKEIPVKWQEPRSEEDKSRVNLFKVSWLYLKEIWRLRFKK